MIGLEAGSNLIEKRLGRFCKYEFNYTFISARHILHVMASSGVSTHAVGKDAHGHVRPVPRAEHPFHAARTSAGTYHSYGLVALTTKTRAVVLQGHRMENSS